MGYPSYPAANLLRSRDELVLAREFLGPVLRSMPSDSGFAEIAEARALYRALGGRLAQP